MNSEPTQTDGNGQYQVVALKYRPQSFGDLVGQGHIATALSNAINKNRVGHAYLFTGARGVGKTSSARIFAKCLNCETGPTMTPCNQCDACDAISAGEDVDVLEIDGASNRGIDEIRQLRSNAAVRPSRSRFKIYIIDEVHMLTMQAFNALLKTLEEPPGHVKFIFCTTDPQKIPITVLSRCQRFDFSPVQTNEIANRLREIAEKEGVTADDQALALLARRANGSMRDSQSLLEQLFSFCETQISVDEVHQLLGTADMSRIAEIAAAMANANPAETLNLINRAMVDGVDAGQVAGQLLGYFRDLMAVKVGCGADTLLSCTESDIENLTSMAEALGLETILTIVQMIDAAVVRMQSSLHARTLLEAAAVRICNLDNLESISDLVKSLSKSGQTGKSTRAAAGRSRPKIQMRQVNVAETNTAGASKKNEIIEPSVNVSRADLASAPHGDPASTSKPAAASINTANSVHEPAQDFSASSTAPQHRRTNDAQKNSASLMPAADSTADASTDGQSQTAPTATPTSDSNEPLATASPSATANGSTDVGNNDIKSVWDDLLEQMGDMTADMASDYQRLELREPGHLLVTLPDTVSKDLCSKPERKQKFESVMHQLTGRQFRVDFVASEKASREHAPAPKLTRVQQIRKLQQEEFVKKTISLFDAEITGYREPAPKKTAAR